MAAPIFAAAASKMAAAAARIGQKVGTEAAKKAAAKTVEKTSATASQFAQEATNLDGDVGEAAGLNVSKMLPSGPGSAATAGTAISPGVKSAEEAVKKGVPGGVWGLVGLTAFIFIVGISVFVSSVMGMMGMLFGGAVGGDAAVNSVQNCGGTASVASGSVDGIHPLILDAINKASAQYNLDWTVLAGMMKVEAGSYLTGDYTKNGVRYVMDASGTFSPKVVGPALDGSGVGGNVTPIYDTDNGRLDGDTVYDHAVGITQVIPTTWKAYSADGNGDGNKDPQNAYDAVFTSANYLAKNQGRKDPQKALAAYNGGWGAAKNPSSYAWTEYVPKVWKFVEQFRNMDISVAPGAVDTGTSSAPQAEGDLGGKVFPLLGGTPTVVLDYNVKGNFPGGYHNGIDFALPPTKMYEVEEPAPAGTVDALGLPVLTVKVQKETEQVPVVAATGGKVTFAGTMGGEYGQAVQIKQPDGYVAVYGKLSTIDVTQGQNVVTGQKIGRGQQSSQVPAPSTTPILHFEIRETPFQSDNDINPNKWFKGAETATQESDPTSIGYVNTNYVSGVGGKIFIEGDSLTVGVRDYASDILATGFGAAKWSVDAETGRTTTEGLSQLQNDKRAQEATTWIVGLGTNYQNNFPALIDQVMQAAGEDRLVIWINAYRPKLFAPAVDPVNTALKDAEAKWSNLKVKDWGSVAKQNPQWLASDGIHYTTEGYKQRAKFYVSDLTGITANSDCQSEFSAAGGGTRGEGAMNALAYAQSQIGRPYAGNGVGPDAFSSPGLIWRSFKEQGVTWPQMSSYAMRKSKYLIEIEEKEQPGDLVFMTVISGSPFLDMGVPRGATISGIISDPGTGKAVASVPGGRVEVISYRDASGNLVNGFQGFYIVTDPSPDSTFLGNSTGGCQVCVDLALAQVGEPYVTNAHPPNTWNCSVLTGWAWEEGTNGKVVMTRYSDSQWDQTTPVPDDALQPGDILFYHTNDAKRTGHVAMYIGNGKMVHAANPDSGVIISNVTESWYKERYMGGRRPTGWVG